MKKGKQMKQNYDPLAEIVSATGLSPSIHLHSRSNAGRRVDAYFAYPPGVSPSRTNTSMSPIVSLSSEKDGKLIDVWIAKSIASAINLCDTLQDTSENDDETIGIAIGTDAALNRMFDISPAFKAYSYRSKQPQIRGLFGWDAPYMAWLFCHPGFKALLERREAASRCLSVVKMKDHDKHQVLTFFTLILVVLQRGLYVTNEVEKALLNCAPAIGMVDKHRKDVPIIVPAQEDMLRGFAKDSQRWKRLLLGDKPGKAPKAQPAAPSVVDYDSIINSVLGTTGSLGIDYDTEEDDNA